MKKVIVVPVTDNVLSGHFGHCEKFYFAETEDGKITGEHYQIPPEHEPGLYPRWVKAQGGDIVLAGGMGQRARGLFAENGVETLVGCPLEDPRKVVEMYLGGTLKTSQNTCDH